MVAVLKPIEVRAIAAPVYDNSNLSVRDYWVSDNTAALLSWWRECERLSDEPSHPGDFERFLWAQWDRETARRGEHANTLRQR